VRFSSRRCSTSALESTVDFADTDFLTSLCDYISEEAVVGFMIENAVLSSIRSIGLAINAEIAKPMALRTLTDPPIFEMDVWDKPVLYRPKPFNFKAIDGMIVLIEPDKNAKKNKNAKPTKPKLFMFPIQITLSPSTHTDSQEKFFKEHYRKWTKDLSDFDVVLEFLSAIATAMRMIILARCGINTNTKRCW